jgi:large subunit ribosomal protein L13
MKTFSIKASEIDKKWLVIDATDLVLGRLATIVANRLRGKHKPEFTPHMDCGDYIIIVNAEKVKVTGNKLTDKVFYWHTNHPGGIKQRTVAETLRSKQPERLIKKAVERMIARGPLARQQMSNLFLYAGPEHPHEAQQPVALDVASMNRKNVRN